MRIPTPDVVAAAQAADRKYGVFASVSLAQYALESAWGAKATGRFNFFGIKADPDQPGTVCWTHEEVRGQLVSCQQRFRDFDSVNDAFAAHAALIALDPRYAQAMAAKSHLDAFVRAMAEHYATDPNYANKLLELIQDESFTRFDVSVPALTQPELDL